MPFEIPIHLRVSGRIDLHLHVDDAEGGKPGLWAPIGPISEQEIPVMNPAITITDSQKFPVGPFQAVDSKGAVIGPASGVVPSTSDSSILTSADNGDGTVEFLGGLPGQAQGICTDGNGKTLVIDVTVIAGAEAGLSATIGAAEEQ